MTHIKRHTKLTADQAYERWQDQYDQPVTGAARIVLKRYVEALERAERTHNQTKHLLQNPLSPAKSPAWIAVHQLIEDLSFQSVPDDLRAELAELEAKLTDLEVFEQ